MVGDFQHLVTMIGKRDRYDDNSSSERHSTYPEEALISFHVSDVREVHAEEAANKGSVPLSVFHVETKK